ncbi:GNAT family N-acetyltransferase [Streptomyces sp. NPDC088358]|uniref:GNAT family N-acetyltransferase n=1 Tax=Streptomyces sp. NPDC088358 TaxID=3365857 RepID=UPI0037F9A9C1
MVMKLSGHNGHALASMVKYAKIKAVAVREDTRGRGISTALLKRCVQIYWQLDYTLIFGEFETFRALGPYCQRHGFTVLEPHDTIDVGTLLTGIPMRLAPARETFFHLRLDDRGLPMDRAHDEEEDLARLLIAAAWYQVNNRTSIGFAYTPLAVTAREDPAAFTLERLLQLPHRDMLADVVAQLHAAADSPLAALRSRTRPKHSLHARPHLPHQQDQRGRRPRRRRAAPGLQEHPPPPHPPTDRSPAAGRLPAPRHRRPLPDRHPRPVPDTLRHSRHLAGGGIPGTARGLPPQTLPPSAPRSPNSSRVAPPTTCRTSPRSRTGSGCCYNAWPPSPTGPLHPVHSALPRLRRLAPRVLIPLVPQPRPRPARQRPAPRWPGLAAATPPHAASESPRRRYDRGYLTVRPPR